MSSFSALHTVPRFSSVQSLSHVSFRPHGLQHTRSPCPAPTPRACSNSCPSSQYCHPTISSSVVPFSSCLQSFQPSGSFPRLICAVCTSPPRMGCGKTRENSKKSDWDGFGIPLYKNCFRTCQVR